MAYDGYLSVVGTLKHMDRWVFVSIDTLMFLILAFQWISKHICTHTCNL